MGKVMLMRYARRSIGHISIFECNGWTDLDTFHYMDTICYFLICCGKMKLFSPSILFFFPTTFSITRHIQQRPVRHKVMRYI